jgi:hypothetical protein
MDLLQKVFEQEVSHGVIATMISEILCTKIEKKGITLSSRQRRSLRDKIAEGEYSGIKIDPLKFWQSQRIDLEITSDDLKDVESSFEKWMERLPDLIEGLSDELAGSLLVTLKNKWPRQSRYGQHQQKAFRAGLDRRWCKAFNPLEMLLCISSEFGADMNVSLRSVPSSNPFKIDVLTRLYARASQVSSEIISLLRCGFADGAMARWRTLHEIVVVSMFIADSDEVLAERYMLHEAVESFRAAKEYQIYCTRIGDEPIDPREIHDLESYNASLVARFGIAFRENYGWASERLGGLRSPKFADIERVVQVDYLRPFYRMASHNVHANPKGAFFKLGLLNETDLLLAGPSTFGLADPGQATALSLVQAATNLLSLDTTLDGVVLLKIMMALSVEIGEMFVAIQKELESEIV